MFLKRISLLVIILLAGLGVIAQEINKTKYWSGDDDGFMKTGVPFGVEIAGDSLLCAGGAVELRVTVNGTEAYRYKWLKDGQALSAKDSCCFVKNRISLADAGKYSCEVTDIDGKVTMRTRAIQVTVVPMPVVTLTASKDRIALGDSVLLTVSGSADRFEWRNAEVKGLTDWVKPQGNTRYTVVGTNSGICPVTKNVDIEVLKLYANAGSDRYLSKGKPVTLTVETNGDEIAWYRQAETPSGKSRAAFTPPATSEYGELAGTGLTITESPAVTTVYTAVSWFNGYSVVSRVTVRVKDNSYGYGGGDDDGFMQTRVNFGVSLTGQEEVCEKIENTLKATVSGTSAYSYEWHKIGTGGDETLAVTEAEYKINACALADIGRYYCVAKDVVSEMTVYSDTLLLTVNRIPEVKINNPTRRDTLICIGKSLLLEALSSVAGATYNWTGGGIVGTAEGEIITVQPTVQTDYVVTADNKGCRAKDTVTIRINTPFVDIPTMATVSEGGRLELTALDNEGRKADAAMLTWRLGTTEFNNYGNPFIIPAVSADMKVVYVTYPNTGDCRATDSTVLRTKGAATFGGGDDDGFMKTCIPPVVIASHGQERKLCAQMDTLQLVLETEGTDIEYQWERMDPLTGDFEKLKSDPELTGIDRHILKFKQLTVKYNGNYRCKLMNSCTPGVYSDTFNVSVKGEPTIVSGLNVDRVARCVNTTPPFEFSIKATSSSPSDVLEYKWFKNGEPIPGANKTFWTVDLNEVNNPNPGGIYVVQVSNACGIAADTAELLVNRPAWIVEQSDTVYACDGGSAKFTVVAGGGGPYTYKLLEVKVKPGGPGFSYDVIRDIWPSLPSITVDNVHASGTYLWKVANCGEMGNNSLMYLKVENQPDFLERSTDQELCEGATLVLECKATPDTRNLFYWKKGNLILPGQTSNRLVIAKVTAADAGVYECFVYNSCQAVRSGTMEVKVKMLPMVVSQPKFDKDKYCIGTKARLETVVDASLPVDSVRWFYKGVAMHDVPGRIRGTGTTVLQIDSVVLADGGGLYFMKIYNYCEPVKTNAVGFIVNSPARFVRGLGDGDVKLIMCEGTSQTLTVKATGTEPIQYIWVHNGKTVAEGFSNVLEVKNVGLDTAGRFECHIQNACGDEITEATIRVSRPHLFAFEGGGRYCEGGSGLNALLQGSDSVTKYALYRAGTDKALKEIHGRDVKPVLGHILFEGLTKGIYYVTGLDTNGCESEMTGRVEVIEDPQPQNFTLSVARHMCTGEVDGDFMLSGSETGVSYYLLRKAQTGWDTLRPAYAGLGTQLPMPNIGAGTYKVFAVNSLTGCGQSLSTIDSMKMRPLPAPYELGVLRNDSVYCLNGKSDVVLSYPDFEAGSHYRLRKNGTWIDPVKNSAPVQWPGAEEGVYQIKVTNKWGCSKTSGRQEVLTQQPPRAYRLLGDRTYCADETGGHLLELEGSDRGVRYVFRELSRGMVKDTLSVGGPVELAIPLQEGHYYVVATDTTPEHCSTAMRDTADVLPSRLQVAANPTTVNVLYGAKAQLKIDITGAQGALTIRWDNEAYLSDVASTEDPWTKIWTEGMESRIFTVTVKDESGCEQQASVTVNRTGGKLTGQINLADCLTSADTLTVCPGVDFTLCGLASGGEETKRYRWWDEQDTLSTLATLTTSRDSSGFIFWEVSDASQTLLDTIWISTGRAPKPFALKEPLSRCALPGSPETFTLLNSESNVLYTLQYSKDGKVYTDDVVQDWGESGKQKDFMVNDITGYMGYFRIMATRTSDDGKLACSTEMTGRAEIRTKPERFNLSGSRTYCSGVTTLDTLVLDSTQTEVRYYLTTVAGVPVTWMKGTGDTIRYIGRYAPGDYLVFAEIGNCRDTMNGRIRLTEHPLPLLRQMTGAGVYCESAGAVEIGIDTAALGINYYLVVDSADGGIRRDTFRFTTLGEQLFGEYSQLGRYHVEAENPLMGCRVEKGEVVIRRSPEIYGIVGDTTYCINTGGVQLGLENTEAGVTYRLQVQKGDATDSWTDYVPKSEIVAGEAGPVMLNRHFPAGEYRFVATAPCEAVMSGTLRVTADSLPDVTLPLQYSGNGCTDSSFVLKIDPTEAGTKYNLLFGGVADATQPSVTATGIEWTIDAAREGTYSVMADRGKCSMQLRATRKVAPVPETRVLAGVSQLCQNAIGELYLLQPEAGVAYSVYAVDSVRATATGVLKGDRVVFAGVPVGDFYVQSQRESCMAAGPVYTIGALAAPDPVRIEASHCIAAAFGEVIVRGMSDSLEYRFTGGSRDEVIRRFSGDSLYVNMPVGIYTVIVRDTVIGCESLPSRDTITEGVYADSLTGGLYYCTGNAGAQLSLSGSRTDIRYSILTKEGREVSAIVNPATRFPGTFQQDTFIFRKVRTGILGGCSADREFVIRETAVPRRDLEVVMSGDTAACAGREHLLTVKATMNGQRYILYKEGVQQQLDTLYGTGADVTFRKAVTEAGRYRILADTAGMCSVDLDTVMVIKPLPARVQVESCSYCYAFGDPVNSDSCRLKLTGMVRNVRYRLNNGMDVDTLSGIGTATFRPQPAGVYTVIPEDMLTQCTDTVRVEIKAMPEPQIFAVLPDCGKVGEVTRIATNGSAAAVDDVTYTLVKNGQPTARSVAGNGSPVAFEGLNEAGVYKINATTPAGCTVVMNDSVTLIEPLRVTSDTLAIRGAFCAGSGGVRLYYGSSTVGWKYYVTRYWETTKVKAGNGGGLEWDSIAMQPITGGTYILKAQNGCGDVMPLDTVVVTPKPTPAVFLLENRAISYCEGTRFELRLSGSQQGVKYTVLLKNRTYGPFFGDAGAISLGWYEAPGKYTVMADSNGCSRLMDEIYVPGGGQPKEFAIVGADKCVGSADAVIRISMPQRETGVTYYLWFNESVLKDVLTDTEPLRLAFTDQTDVGCYTVKAKHGTSGCMAEMPGKNCLAPAPLLFAMENPGDTIRMCNGMDTSLYLSNSQSGVLYTLEKDGVEYGTAKVEGKSGQRICVGEAKHTGIYRVRVKMGECNLLMEDSVIVKVNELPALALNEEELFCEGAAGAEVEVKFPFLASYKYTLSDPSGRQIESRFGGSDPLEKMVFAPVYGEGRYTVTVTNPATHCNNVQKVDLIMDPLPQSFDLSSGSGAYLCVDGCTTIRLEKRESGVEYTLHRKSPVAQVGTLPAGSLAFTPEVCDTGVYFVRAHFTGTPTQCGSSFGALHLERSDSVRQYKLIRVKNGYCESDVAKGTIKLNKSDVGVMYELWRDGAATGMSLAGTGGELTWTGVPGKPCDQLAHVQDGYGYSIRGRNVKSGCMKVMAGTDTIVEEAPVKILASEPNDVLLEKCNGDPIYFNVTTSGCNERYTWYRNGTAVKSGRENYYNIEAMNVVADEGTYYCDVTNMCGTVTSKQVRLSIRNQVTLAKPMGKEVICDPMQREVTLLSGFQDAVNYVWYRLGETDLDNSITGNYRQVLKLTGLTPESAGKYICKAWNPCNTVYDTCEVLFGTRPAVKIEGGKIDTTLCQGAEMTIKVTPEGSESVEWYFNGRTTGKTGNVYATGPLTPAQEGIYTVSLRNVCAVDGVSAEVAVIRVDVPIEVLKSSDTMSLRCPGKSDVLFISTSPSDRVTYRWEYKGEILPVTGNTLAVGPFGEASPLTYRVYYSNRCTAKYRNFGISVPKPIKFNNPDREIILCADCSRDTVLRLKLEPSMFPQYEWYYRANAVTAEREELGTADTLAINRCPDKTGFYYCKVDNGCSTEMTQTTWVRIDSVPLFKEPLRNDTICEGGWFRVELDATGGGLKYVWHILKKDGSEETKENGVQDAYESTGKLELNNITMAYDSCLIWCYASNSCGTVYSDTMVLRIDQRRDLSVTPEVAAICSTDTAKIEVRLFNGVLPWSYTYTTPSGAEVKVTKIRESVHLLKVQEAGVYQITALEDTVGCIRLDGLPSVEVTHLEGSFVALSGGGARCAGDTVSVHVAITGEGTGPWELWFGEKDNKPLPAVNPLVMYGKDTTLMLTAMDSVVYYLTDAKDLSGGAAACPVDVDGEAVILTTVPDVIDFALSGDDHIGQCNPVNLYTKLNPTHRNSPEVVPKGWFYLNTGQKPVAYDNLTPDMLKRLKGRQTVRCEYKNALGCLVSSDEVVLTVDTLPFATITMAEHACGNVQTEYAVELSGTPKFTLELEQRLFSYSRYHLDEQFRRWTPELGVKDTVYKGVRFWTETDSCLILRVVAVTDRHGCRVTSPETALPSDTVYHHLYPDLEIRTRYPNVEKSGWTKGMSPVYIARGDSVGVKATLTQGDRPWNMICSPRGSIRGIHGTDTVFALDTGRYRITAVHEYCNVSASYGEELVVSYRDTGYLKMKVLLDGPFDVVSGEMQTLIEDKLPLYGITALPDRSRVRDKQIIDWIEVELRTGNQRDSIARLGSGTVVVAHDTCLLWSDGTVTDRLGDTVIALPGASVQGINNYYVLVRHRNHLGVMSARTFPVSRKRSDVKKVVDFTKAGSIYTADGKQKLHMSELGSADRPYWALSAGDMNANALVSVFDPNKMNLDELSPDSPGIPAPDGYNIFDVNFDGQIGWPGWGKEGTLDWDKVRGNRHQFMEVRF